MKLKTISLLLTIGITLLSCKDTIKKEPAQLNLEMFSPSKLDDYGNMVFLENTKCKTAPIALEKGSYNLELTGYSLPKEPIKGENAHILIKANNIEIANFNLSNDSTKSENKFTITYDKDTNVSFEIIYDNDLFDNGLDRNALIQKINLKKIL